MAFTVTERGFDTQNSSAADLTFGAFTPAANSMLVAVIAGGASLTVNGLSGHTGGAAWVQIVSIPDFSTTNRDFQVWACFPGASPSSATVAIDINYADTSMAALYEVGGIDVSGSVANAFGVSGSEYGYDLSPWTAALGAFASATNLTFAVGVQADSSPTFTWEGGYTVGTAQTGFLRLQAAWIAAEDNSVVLTTESAKHALLWATEIKEAASGGSTITPGRGQVATGGQIPGELRDLTQAPVTGAASSQGRAPSLWTERVISPATPELAGEANDLIPTLSGFLANESSVTPGSGLVSVVGRIPSFVTEVADATALADVGLVTVAGLAPTLVSEGETRGHVKRRVRARRRQYVVNEPDAPTPTVPPAAVEYVAPQEDRMTGFNTLAAELEARLAAVEAKRTQNLLRQRREEEELISILLRVA